MCSEVLELCIETGFLTQAGSWFTLRLPWEPVISSDTADAAETPQSGEEEEEESPDHWEEVLKVQGLHSVRSEMAARCETHTLAQTHAPARPAFSSWCGVMARPCWHAQA